METSYQEIIRSFVDKYGLSRGQVIAEIEKTFSSMLTGWHGHEVVAMFSDNRLQAVGYYESNGMMTQIPIELTSMRGWNSIRRILDKNLERASCLQEVARYKRKERQLRWGEIIRKKKDGALYVEIEIETGTPVIAVCPGNHIGIHERERLMVGQRRAFHLRRVEPVLLKNTARVKVGVDRVSKTLVEKLLLSKMENKVKIRCLNRYVGKKSFVQSNVFLPKQIIIETSQELHEHIQVRVVRDNRGGWN
jgi:hypothetical protein